MGGPALVVFARAPVAGAVKTRLLPYLTADEAAALHQAFVLDALEKWSTPGAFDLGVPPAVRLYVAPEGGPWPAGQIPPGVALHEQRGDGLGSRMLRAAVETFAAGHDAVVIIGTDHPTLPPSFVAEAFRALDDRRSVAFGPSEDGGYYLIGFREVIPPLFEGLTYGHGAVLSQALARASDVGGRPVILPAWYDVDTPADLERLFAERAAGAEVGPRTGDVLDAIRSAGSARGGYG